MKNYLDKLPRPFFALAPMDDVTDTVFRQIVSFTAAADLYFTEFTNVDGLQSSGRANLFKRLRATNLEEPLVAQFWGKTPQNYFLTARQISDGSLMKEIENSGEFAGFDINMGCPDKAIIKNGCCGALIENRPLAKEIIEATREGLGGKLPLSIKTRVGLKAIDLSWIEFLLRQNIDMLCVHVRTVKEKSLVPAHHELFSEISTMRDKISPTTILVGNGDIESRSQAKILAQKTGLDGVMIGRGIFKDPFVFSSNSPWTEMTPNERLELYVRHVRLFRQTWGNNERKVHTLNKFCKIYVNGFDGAKDLREKLMDAKSADDLLDLLSQVEANVRTLHPSAT